MLRLPPRNDTLPGMVKTDRRIDAYIAKAAPFARPILSHLRKLVHQGCPEVEETIRWGMPSFTHKGILCGMAAFKAHATFGLWKGSLILDSKSRRADEAMGNFGRLRSLKDLPSDKTLLGYIRKAVALNESGVKTAARAKTKTRRPLRVPEDLKAALKNNRKAQAVFDGFSHSHKKEYVEWLTTAKQETTRQRRLAQAIAWIAEGKIRNWKYEKC
jgi:uncharacterized protein YdeI (YjbR/CyaY-like superfamily)